MKVNGNDLTFAPDSPANDGPVSNIPIRLEIATKIFASLRVGRWLSTDAKMLAQMALIDADALISAYNETVHD